MEENYIKLSIEEALRTIVDKKGRPKVGAVIVKNDKVLDVAYENEDNSGDSAIFILINKKLKDVSIKGSALYTTLEPNTEKYNDKESEVNLIMEQGVAIVCFGMYRPRMNTRAELILGQLIDELFRYPTEYITEIRHMNLDFIDIESYGKIRDVKDTSEYVEQFKDDSIDDWYIRINRIYWSHNYYKTPEMLFSHLVEVIGGISLLASEKKKIGINPYSYIVKALAWWFALCGKLGIRSISELLWNKFPNVCPYCLGEEHIGKKCEEFKGKNISPNWKELEIIKERNSSKRPKTIKDWQLTFLNIYPILEQDNLQWSFSRLSEEVGELAEALRIFKTNPNHFLSEAADVFAWIMHLQNLIENKANVPKVNTGVKIAEEIANAYPGLCQNCGNSICSCPPILEDTLGRITTESPQGKVKYGLDGMYLTPREASDIFGNK